MAITPYVVGQWVRNRSFYGRDDLLSEILDGNRDALWLLGTRRIGKTSVLKQLELLTSTSPNDQRYFPLFWDFQGAEDVEDLHEGFRDALLDADQRLEAAGFSLDEIDDPDLFRALTRLRRTVRASGRTLLLLGDEAEQLVAVFDRAPSFLARLRRALLSSEGIRTVLASTIRLWKLASEETSTSPFLQGFTPALALRRLDDASADALIRQDGLPEESRPSIDPQEVVRIRTLCNGHPYLMQLLGERHHELGDLAQAIEQIETDQMVGFFFASDLGMLNESEREILRLIDRSERVASATIQEQLAFGSTAVHGGLKRLELLGFVESNQAGEFSIVNSFFRRWLRESAESTATPQTTQELTGEGGAAREETLVSDRYRLLERLGGGSTGEVFKAQDTLLETVVGLKLFKREYSIDDTALERLRREVVLARDLSHPNVLKLYHLGDDNGQRYLTMQFVEGRTLARLLNEESPLPIDRALIIARKLASALSALHRCDVLHRDIKPSNVLIDPAGEPHLMDFGLARLQTGPSVTRDGLFVGTPAYASPEQAIGKPLDTRSDLYALGAVFFEMLTGRRPFHAITPEKFLALHAATQPPSPREIRPSIPLVLSHLVLRCLEKLPENRFQTADELYEMLSEYSEWIPDEAAEPGV